MNKAIAIANNDTVFLSWIYDTRINGCLGFAVNRIDSSKTFTPLPAWVGFRGGSNPDWQPKDTTVWPVQKFGWRDFTAVRGATYTYEIVPMTGSPGHLQPKINLALRTNSVTLTPVRGSFSVYFTNGILATQALTHVVPAGKNGAPAPDVLDNRIDQPGDPLRVKLAGQILEGVTSLLDRAETEGGDCFAALYELDDPELIKRLLDAKNYLHLILGNTGASDSENRPARQALHSAGIDITDRMVGNGHIAHNKFCIYRDQTQVPRAVLTGSTNWTSTGLCTQSNNAVVIENDALAKAYFDYWDLLKTDVLQSNSNQAPPLRQADTTSHSANIDGASTTIWFSPNTKARSKPKNNPPTPPDMQQVFAAMAQAKQAIIFLVFQPGSPSIVEYAAACENAKPGLLIYGAATDPHANQDYKTLLFHRSTKNMAIVDDNKAVVSASGINTQFAYWQKELLKLPNAHAIIHDKIVVIDPMSPDCVVITGSHNQGFRASYANDENFIIVRGHQELASAYATHVMDVYDHYRWRFTLSSTSLKNAFSGLDPTAAWQDKYFAANSTARQEALFWTGQLPALPPAPAPTVPMKPATINAKSGGRMGKTAAKKAAKNNATTQRAKSKTKKAAKKPRKRRH